MPDFESRIGKLRKRLTSEACPSLLITNFTNVTYLTGFTGDDSFLLVTPEQTLLLTDGRYETQLQQECPGLDLFVRPYRMKMIQAIEKTFKRHKISRLAIESQSMTIKTAEEIKEKVKNIQLKPVGDAVESLRQIKDAEEVAEIRASVALAERVFQVVKASLRAEQTEREVAALLEYQARLFGGAGCSFQTIVGVGPNAAKPHAGLTDARIGEGSLVLIDWGVKQRLYTSDLTRTLAVNKISPKLQRMYEVVLAAQQAGIDAIRPGAKMCDVDAAARKVISDAGLGKKYNHGLGHGIGLEVHEGPRLSAVINDELKAGMVVTVEPGVYQPGWGGIRIEDDVLVTRHGAERLSTLPRELESLGLV